MCWFEVTSGQASLCSSNKLWKIWPEIKAKWKRLWKIPQKSWLHDWKIILGLGPAWSFQNSFTWNFLFIISKGNNSLKSLSGKILSEILFVIQNWKKIERFSLQENDLSYEPDLKIDHLDREALHSNYKTVKINLCSRFFITNLDS